MAKYLYVYHGGSAPSDEQEMQKVMAAWQQWFGDLGAAVVDGGNPVGQSHTVQADGVSADGGANPASGYSVVEAESAEKAIEMAKGCPILQDNGSVEVAEVMEM